MPAVTGPVQEAQGGATNSTAGGTWTITFPNNPAAGNSVIVQASAGAIGTQFSALTPSGLGATWTRELRNALDGSGAQEVWLGKGCNGSTKVITMTNGAGTTSQDVAGIASEWSPLASVGFTNTAAGVGGASPSTLSTLSIANVAGHAYQVFIDAMHVDGSATAPTGLTAGYTAFTGKTQDTLRVDGGYRILPTSPTGSYGTQWTLNASFQNYRHAVLTFFAQAQAAVNGSATLAATGTLVADLAGVIPDNALPLVVRIYAAADPRGLPIAELEGYRGLKYDDPYNGLGEGQFEMALSDAKATAANLAVYNLVRIFAGPFDIGQFWINSTTRLVGSPESASGERVTVAGLGLEAYLRRAVVAVAATYTGETAGAILVDQIELAFGHSALDHLTYDFTATVDSAGVAWSGTLAALTMTFNAGSTLLDVLNQLRQIGVYAQMRRDFTLQMWTADPGITQSAVILREGKHLLGAVTWSQTSVGPVNAIVVSNGSGLTQLYSFGLSGLPEWIFGYVTAPLDADLDTMEQVATAEYARRLQAQEAISVPVKHGLGAGEYEPYRHYNKGDWLPLDIPGSFDKVSEQVAAIHLASDDSGWYSVTLDLAASQPDVQVLIAKKVAELARP